MNEELQPTNEELETSREEMQSINEELNTVNAQLSSKVAQLDRSNGDLKNLFDSTRVATVFLDPFLIIRSFTPEIAGI
jgi:two-component system CheB/CheR fusion protein